MKVMLPPESLADISPIGGVGTCKSCVRDECLQPKHAREHPEQGCREGWTDGEVIVEIDEHWPCPDCDEILFTETADKHLC